MSRTNKVDYGKTCKEKNTVVKIHKSWVSNSRNHPLGHKKC